MRLHNVVIKVWQFSLWFLGATVAIICAPASLLVSAPLTGGVLVARHRARVRHDRYSWSEHRPGRSRKSGYRRRRQGFFG